MRILNIRFKNLNSLAGEWCIDLTHPAFVSDGIFAITGPTGAGKSTILDAICLALYAQTPRLGKVTKGGNDIMSRRTADCLAEVVFETASGRYRCLWSQHRARGKVNGDLQAAKHEISLADSGEILSSKVSEVPELVVAQTGMSFEQFTRSMLLAQGGFAAFLQSGAGDRAPILEQITGTEIYTDISRLTFQRHSAEKHQLEVLQAELSGMTLLDDAQIAECESRLEAHRTQEHTLESGLQQTRTALNWRETQARIEQELLENTARREVQAQRHEAFRPQQARLALAQHALELAADHSTLKSLRQVQDANRQQQAALQTELPQRVADVAAARTRQQQREAERQQLQADWTALQPLLKQVTALDGQWDAVSKAGRQCQAECREHEAVLAKILTALQADRQQLEQVAAQRTAARDYLQAHAADAELAQRLPLLDAELVRLETARQTVLHKQQSWRQGQARLAEREREFREAEQAAALATTRRDDAQREFEHHAAERNRLLDGHAPAELNAALLELLSRQNRLRELVQDRLRDTQLSRERVLIEAEIQQHQQTQQQWQAERPAVESLLQTVITNIGLLEGKQQLLARLHSLGQHRQQLQDGQACPLCGATDHPYAQGNLPPDDDTQQALAQARREEAAATRRLTEGDLRNRHADDARQTLNSRLAHADNELAALRQRISNDGAELGLAGANETELQQALQRVQEERQQLSQRLADADVQQQALIQTEAALKQSAAVLDSAGKALLALRFQHEEAGREAARLQEEHQEMQEQSAQQEAAIRQSLSACGLPADALADPKQAVQQLAQRRDDWQARTRESQELQERLVKLEEAVAHRRQAQIDGEGTRNTLQARLDKVLAEAVQLAQQRQALFADRDPDTEEARAQAALQQAEQQRQLAVQALQQAEQAERDVQSRITVLEQALARTEDELEPCGIAFNTRLTQAGFADEAAYVAACLPESERQQLQAQADALTRAQAELDSRARALVQQQADEHARALTDLSHDELSVTLHDQGEALKALQQAMGALQRQLLDNAALRQSRQSLVDAMALRQREVARWGRLNELIGAADGKKFRNFAQGLTFDILIHHANRQLQKLSDRYLLVRDSTQPLELNVMDNYQAGEVRPTRNLSGGESFLVSLALALGLSHMASRNVRVDSLFLDEGFGTLDEDALDTALTALSGLQQSGKLVGVISHVGMLKERIATQIKVEPGPGGRSRVEGPGCWGG